MIIRVISHYICDITRFVRRGWFRYRIMFKGSHNITNDIPSPQVSTHGTSNYPTLLNLYVPYTILLVLQLTTLSGQL